MSIRPPFDLRCEFLRDPVGVDTARPRLSWRLESAERGDRATAFHVVVSSAAELAASGVGDLWDSGLIETVGPPRIEYQGEPLSSCARSFWRVRWRDRSGALSPWSEPASFVTAFLAEGEWKPRWISARSPREFRSRGTVVLGESGGEAVQYHAIYLRREFAAREKPALALAFVSGLGSNEFRLNGERVGDRVLDPGWTDYRKRALFSSYDVTGLIREKNAAGLILGNGRHVKDLGYDPPKAACRIEVEYESGDREIVMSDENWRTSPGPIQENGLYFGEKYDARLEMPGWDLPGFDDASWDKAVNVQGPPLVSQMMPPIRVTETIRPVKVAPAGAGSWIFDFGQNFSGWTRLRVEGPRGTEIRLRHAELLHEDGSLNTGPNENAEAVDTYVLRGGGSETWEPAFTYHGFRYVGLSGYPGEPSAETLEGRFVHSDVARTGRFACSHELINRIHANVGWGQLSNLMSIPTDCPQRDERHGWLGDAYLSAEEAMFNFDMAAFYGKFLDDIRLAVREDGSLPDVAPAYLPRTYPADPAWGSAYAGILWLMYEHYEDARLLARHCGPLKRYIEFLGRNADGFIIRTLGKYGDWCPPGSVTAKKTPVELTSTWSYYHDVLIAGRIARVLGRSDDARLFEKLAAEIREAFNAAFLSGGQYAAVRASRIDTYPNQTSNVLPLQLDMVPPSEKEKVVAALLESVERHQDFHVDTGILGTRGLLDVLTRCGRGETAFRVATQTSYPGWGYMIAEGATTLWERWERLTGSAMNSQNHIMLGAIDAWFYRTIGGLSPLEPGWKKIGIRPRPFSGLSHAEASVETVRGKVRCAWRKEETGLRLEASVPVGATARIAVPAAVPGSPIYESGRNVWQEEKAVASANGVTAVGRDGDAVVFETESGEYVFEAVPVIGGRRSV